MQPRQKRRPDSMGMENIMVGCAKMRSVTCGWGQFQRENPRDLKTETSTDDTAMFCACRARALGEIDDSL